MFPLLHCENSFFSIFTVFSCNFVPCSLFKLEGNSLFDEYMLFWKEDLGNFALAVCKYSYLSLLLSEILIVVAVNLTEKFCLLQYLFKIVL